MTYRNEQSTKRCEKCGNDLWDVRRFEEKAYCSNCGWERDFKTRKRRNDYITKSQRAQANMIKTYFENRGKVLAIYEEELWETGDLSIRIETSDNPYINQGGHWIIGRKGKTRQLSIYDLCASEENKKWQAKHYAKVFNAHMGWD